MANVSKVQVFKRKDGEWAWRRIAGNGEPVLTPGEGYEHRQHAIDQAQELGGVDGINVVLEVEPE